MPTRDQQPSARRRRGLTAVETLGVLGCLAAGLVCGFWLLGEDFSQLMRQTLPVDSNSASSPAASAPPRVFQGELEQHLHRVEPRDEIETATYDADGERQSADVNARSTNDTTAAPVDKDAVRALLAEVDSPSNDAAEQTTAAAAPANRGERSATSSAAAQQTLAYWNAMNDIMAQEESLRAAPIGGLTEQNAADFMARRGEAGRFAAQALRALDTSGVDPAAVQLCGQIAAWYERGTRLNDRAEHLYHQASDATRRGQAGKSWSEAEKAHNASVAALNRRGDQLQREFTRKYGVAFPDLR